MHHNVPLTLSILAKSGYYDGDFLHRIINMTLWFKVDPTGTAESFGGSFQDEFSEELYNLRVRLWLMLTRYKW